MSGPSGLVIFSKLNLISCCLEAIHMEKQVKIFVQSRRWQAPGTVKKSRIARNPKELASAYIYDFHDSERKVEFEARIKPCSHQPNCIQFLL